MYIDISDIKSVDYYYYYMCIWLKNLLSQGHNYNRQKSSNLGKVLFYGNFRQSYISQKAGDDHQIEYVII